MPVIPLPPAVDRGTFSQQARSIPELTVRATPAAFGANVAEENYRGNVALMGNIASQARAEGDMWNTAIRGVIKEAGEAWQKDQRLEAEARLHDLSLGITRESEAEGNEATGDGAHRVRTMATFEDRARELEEGARTPYQAGLYREGIQRLRFQHERQAVSAEVAAHRAARLENINTIVEAAELEIFRNPGTLDAARERVLATIGDANVPPAQRARLLREAEGRLVQIAIERHMTSNNPGAAQALLGNDRNVTALGGLNAARASARIGRAVEEARERAAAVQAQTELINGTRPFDPANQEHRRVIESAFTATNGPQQLAAMDNNAVLSVSGIARRYGVVPPSAISLLQGMLANGSSEQQIFALQSISTIETARPGAFENTPLHRTARAEADDFRFMTTGIGGLGLDPAEALRRITERRSPEFQERAEARRTRAREIVRRLTDADVADIFRNDPRDPWFGRSTVGNDRDAGVMLGAFQRAFEFHYTRTGVEADALAGARADLQRVYGVTRQSGDGPRIVRRPVELVYPAVNESHDWIRNQLVEIIRTERGITVRPEHIVLEATVETERAISRGGVDAGHLPPYAFSWRRPGIDLQSQTIPGRLFTPDLAEARRVATGAAETTRQEAARVDRAGRDRTLGGPDVGRRRTPFALDPFVEAPVVPGHEPETLSGEERRRRVRDRSRASVLDLLGWGARMTREGAN